MTPEAFLARAPGDVLAALADHARVDEWLDRQTLVDRPEMERVLALAHDATADLPLGAHLLAARLAEADGDVEAMNAHLGAAIRLDTGAPAISRELAYGALLRGNAALALEMVGHTGLRLAPSTIDVLRLHADPPRCGRNERCPCGSGRKSKHCCPSPPRPLWQRAHLLYEKVCAYGERWHHDEWVTEACRRLHDVDDAPELLAGLVSTMPEAWTYLVFGAGLVDRFADDPVAALLPADERELLASWRGLPVRLLRLDEVLPSTGARVTDTLTGERFQLTIALDGTWRPGEEAFGFVVPGGDGTLFLPGDPVLVPPEWGDDVVGEVDVHDAMAVGRWVVRATTGCLLLLHERERAERVRLVFGDVDHDEPGWITEDEIFDLVRDAHPTESDEHLLLLACAARRIVDDDPPGTCDEARRRLGLGVPIHDVLGDLGAAIVAELLARADAR